MIPTLHPVTLLAQAPVTGEGLTRTQQLLADDPIWLILIKVVGLFALGVLLTLFMINWERKVVARMQQRPGPNRVGPNGSGSPRASRRRCAPSGARSRCRW